eukprot:CAMPEP_0171351538 /NCGR_PEP_ID=MMETSP0878-20121228/39330_1 /TAXON_ID=67004 /ORGANISM="Thalassiosira weissflogii, Strain CCMP1336" /LENGTH=630 /DNA_ID=CAMNT_0011856869 /DNA_START=150 /DNA_END=2042 /DNA_ORIENTATION=+
MALQSIRRKLRHDKNKHCNNTINNRISNGNGTHTSSFIRMNTLQTKSHILMGTILLFTLYGMSIQHFHTLERAVDDDSTPADRRQTTLQERDPSDLFISPEPPKTSNPQKTFSCSVFWLRMPKTASTSVMRTFIGPLFQSGRFTNTEIDPNTCITGVGGCERFWAMGHQGFRGSGGGVSGRGFRGRGAGVGFPRERGFGGGFRPRAGGVDVDRDESDRFDGDVDGSLEQGDGEEETLIGPRRGGGGGRVVRTRKNVNIYTPPYDYRLMDNGVNMGNGNQTQLLQHNNSNYNTNNNFNQYNPQSLPQRCFPQTPGPTLHCYEYDPRTSTMNFGPHRRNPKKMQQRLQLMKNPNLPLKHVPPVPSVQTANYDYSPSLKTHVGLDPTLFGWILPENPMVFSTFREPIERLLSSFHYGIQFGGGRPGEVGKCMLPGVEKLEDWQARVIEARKAVDESRNDTTVYQNVLKEYLTECKSAADNAYVQFLDPNTKNVNVALENLEKYVIVGLQTHVEESLERWMNITLRSCRGRPQFPIIKDRLQKEYHTQAGKKWRASDLLTDSELKLDGTPKNNDHYKHEKEREGEEPTVKLASPKFESFDEDLQKLILEYTAGDAVIFQRVLEMYEEQRHWGLE